MHVDKFIRYLSFEKRYSAHTIQAYQSDLNSFYTYIKQVYDLGTESIVSITRNHIRSWMVELMQQQRSGRSIQRKLSSLKSYFRFLLKEGILTQNPSAGITAPKASKRLPVYLDEEKCARLFNELDQLTGSGSTDEGISLFAGMRDKLMIRLLYQTGIRRSELISLRLESIDKKRRIVLVEGKGNKERMLPVSEALLKEIDEYSVLRESLFGNYECRSLFLTNKGESLYPRFVYRKVNEYLSRVSTAEKKSPHVMRHTFATHLANQGADLNAIKELLGHASLASTQVYTHNSIEKLKEVYLQAHPKSKS